MADEQSTIPPPDGATSAQTTDVPPSDSSSTSALASSIQPPSPSPGGPPSPALSSHSSSSTSTPSTPPLPPLPSALYDALHPALAHCDTAIESVFTSQSQLASHIDTLAALLTQFNALHTTSAQLFTPYTAKLQSAKKRIRRLQTSVDRINGRLNDMRDTVRRKEGLGGNGAVVGVGGLSGRLSLSSIAAMAQQALAVGGDSGGGVVEKSEAGSAAGADPRVGVDVVGEEKEEEDESVDEMVGEIEKIEALAPVLDKSTTPTAYGSLPTSLPSPTAASPPSTAAQHTTANGAAASRGTATATSAAAALSKSPSASSAPSNTALLHDLLAWDGQ